MSSSRLSDAPRKAHIRAVGSEGPLNIRQRSRHRLVSETLEAPGDRNHPVGCKHSLRVLGDYKLSGLISAYIKMLSAIARVHIICGL